ncbi:IclR family transcriptional regulator C-terminal domain-containing protein [Phenylobacterium sp.]|uniref:IclR family transcriptional regulator domain-containing protein n=1 Tax=Phenylobacterium sp. TaxID=1871053 RepID=UPI003523461A
MFAAYLPRELVAPLLDAEFAAGVAPRMDNRKLNKAEFDAYLETVRDQQFAFQRGDLLVGLQGLAVPVFDAEQRMVLSLSMVSLVGQRDLEPDGEIAAHLRAAAHEISASLGAQA